RRRGPVRRHGVGVEARAVALARERARARSVSARTTLLRHATLVATMDDARREIADGAVLIRGNAIEAVGATADLPATADETIDLAGHVVLPGLVNTHHHLFQTLTRALPAAQDASLFGWLQ